MGYDSNEIGVPMFQCSNVPVFRPTMLFLNLWNLKRKEHNEGIDSGSRWNFGTLEQPVQQQINSEKLFAGDRSTERLLAVSSTSGGLVTFR